MKRFVNVLMILVMVIATLTPAANTKAAEKYTLWADITDHLDQIIVKGTKRTITVEKWTNRNDGTDKGYAVKPSEYKKYKITFKSSKPAVATVNSKGVVTAKKNGKTNITVSSSIGTRKMPLTVVSKGYTTDELSIHGITLDLTKNYTDKQIKKLFGEPSRVSQKYVASRDFWDADRNYVESKGIHDYKAIHIDANKVKANLYYMAYTDNPSEWVTFEFYKGKLNRILSSADSLKSGDFRLGMKAEDFKGNTGTSDFVAMADYFANNHPILFVEIQVHDSPFVDCSSNYGYKIPKDLYLLQMDVINGMRWQHSHAVAAYLNKSEEEVFKPVVWDKDAYQACKEHITYMTKHGEYSHYTSDGETIESRLEKRLSRRVAEEENITGIDSYDAIATIRCYMGSEGHRKAFFRIGEESGTVYFGSYTDRDNNAMCLWQDIDHIED